MQEPLTIEGAMYRLRWFCPNRSVSGCNLSWTNGIVPAVIVAYGGGRGTPILNTALFPMSAKDRIFTNLRGAKQWVENNCQVELAKGYEYIAVSRSEKVYLHIFPNPMTVGDPWLVTEFNNANPLADAFAINQKWIIQSQTKAPPHPVVGNNMSGVVAPKIKFIGRCSPAAAVAPAKTSLYTIRTYYFTDKIHSVFGFSKPYQSWITTDALHANWDVTCIPDLSLLTTQLKDYRPNKDQNAEAMIVNKDDMVIELFRYKSDGMGGYRWQPITFDCPPLSAVDLAKQRKWIDSKTVLEKPTVIRARFPYRPPTEEKNTVFLGTFEECDVWHEKSETAGPDFLLSVYGRGSNQMLNMTKEWWIKNGEKKWTRLLPHERAVELAMEKYGINK